MPNIIDAIVRVRGLQLGGRINQRILRWHSANRHDARGYQDTPYRTVWLISNVRNVTCVTDIQLKVGFKVVRAFRLFWSQWHD